MNKKEKYLKESFEIIRSKNLQVPFKLDACTTVTDLEQYLRVLSKSVMHNDKIRLKRLFHDKIEELKKL